MSETATPVKGAGKTRKDLDRAVIRFAGDSGDGMQLTGEQFTTESAWAGNDLATLPNFPAEIRAPAGTLFGVSSFQLQFGSQRVYTPGDRLDCLVAMNPAALKVHLADLKPGGLLIVNTAAFEKRNLDKAGYPQNPLDDPALAERYRLHKIDMTGLTIQAIADLKLDTKEKDRTKNFFALGLVSWIYTRPLEPTLDWITKKFAKMEAIAEANTRVLKAGHAFGETAEFFEESLHDRAGRDGAGPLSRDDRQPGARLGPAGRRRALQGARRLRRLSDHAGLERPRRAGDAQALPHPDHPGRGRDRGGRPPPSARPSAAPSASRARAAPASRSRARGSVWR